MSQGHPATGTAGFGAGAGAGMALEQEGRALGIRGASLLLIPIIPMENPSVSMDSATGNRKTWKMQQEKLIPVLPFPTVAFPGEDFPASFLFRFIHGLGSLLSGNEIPWAGNGIPWAWNEIPWAGNGIPRAGNGIP